MAAPQRSAEKPDRYPYGWWFVFGPSPLLKRGKTDKRSSAQEVEEKKKAKERENQCKTFHKGGHRGNLPCGLIPTPSRTGLHIAPAACRNTTIACIAAIRYTTEGYNCR